MTLADERRAIADGMAASRASTSEASRAATSEASRNSSRQAIAAGRAQSSEAARRAVGRSLEEQRRGKTLPDDLNSLKPPERKGKNLAPREKTGGRSATRGFGYWDPSTPSSGGAGGGIASPLTEQTKVVEGITVPDRDYYGTRMLTSSDGIFTLEVMPIKTLRLKDDAEADAVIFLAEPPA
ncbi:hypothetical protein [Pseudomonas sp. USHLN015]|uniref:hypothetical protein n=1 Tax=Pseudomonas sp. USHLN015 TaxID=3081296 RepID=UPI00301B93B5